MTADPREEQLIGRPAECPDAGVCTCLPGECAFLTSTFHPLGPNDKPTNPKDIVGSNKLPLHMVPTSMVALASLAFLNGALKYGRTNWRHTGVLASVYYSAAIRHLNAWWEGEEFDEEGVPHLASALACIGIVNDAKMAGKLRDDRAFKGAGYRALVNELTPVVAALRSLHAGKAPKQYTIADNLG